ncbi:MAG: hypothetical protein ACT4TC_13845, partial [Myxococcaceae bacterium]
MPKELQRAQDRLAKIQEAKAALEAEAKAAQEQEAKEKSEPPSGPSSELPTHQVPHRADGTPTDKAQRNFTDPDCGVGSQPRGECGRSDAQPTIFSGSTPWTHRSGIRAA